MRDLFLTLFVFGMLPVSFARPFMGLLMWSWLTYMNPQRLTWSFAYDFRFNYFIAIATLLGVIFQSRIRLRIPMTPATVFLLVFAAWTTLTTIHSFNPQPAWWEWNRFMKIQAMVLATFIVVHNRRDLHQLVLVIAFSFAFYGLKGGFFTITTGGRFHVLGPVGSFFRDNNTLALALIMSLPLISYVQMESTNRYVRWGCLVTSLLSTIAVLGTYSRGGMVGLAVLLIFFWLKMRRKFLVLLLMLIALPAMYVFMPSQWHSRMSLVIESVGGMKLDQTLDEQQPVDFSSAPIPGPEKNRQESHIVDQQASALFGEESELLEDLSVQGRFNAWNFALAVARDRPVLGGGFQAFTQDVFDRYYPGIYRRDAHSIYFEVLAEQGYVGFFFWAMMHILAFRNGRWVIRHTRGQPGLSWATNMAAMLQVGLIGYYTSGVFLGLAYFDLPYHYVSILIILKRHVEGELRRSAEQAQASEKRMVSIFQRPAPRSTPPP